MSEDTKIDSLDPNKVVPTPELANLMLSWYFGEMLHKLREGRVDEVIADLEEGLRATGSVPE